MEHEKKQKTPPTSADIRLIVEKAIRKIVSPELEPLKKNVDYLMKKDNEAKVIADYLKKNPQKQPKADTSTQQWLNRELLKALIYALAIIGALVGAKLWQ